MSSLNLIVRRVLIAEAPARTGRPSPKNTALAAYMYELYPSLYETGGSIEQTSRAFKSGRVPSAVVESYRDIVKVLGSPTEERDTVIKNFRTAIQKAMNYKGRMTASGFSVPKLPWPFNMSNVLDEKNYNQTIFPGNVLEAIVTNKRVDDDLNLARNIKSSIENEDAASIKFPIFSGIKALDETLTSLAGFFDRRTEAYRAVAEAKSNLLRVARVVGELQETDEDEESSELAAGMSMMERRSLAAALLESSADFDELDEPAQVSLAKTGSPVDLNDEGDMSVDAEAGNLDDDVTDNDPTQDDRSEIEEKIDEIRKLHEGLERALDEFFVLYGSGSMPREDVDDAMANFGDSIEKIVNAVNSGDV